LILAAVATLGLVPSLRAVTIQDFFVSPPGSTPFGMTAGPDGNVWFTGVSTDSIFRITPAGVTTQYILPTAHAAPTQITTGPDGNLWFTESFPIFGVKKIGRLNPLNGFVTEFPLAGTDAFPVGITSGPDGALWFTEPEPEKIGRITTSGAVTEFTLPNPEINRNPTYIVSGPDGALWFTIGGVIPGGLGRITTAGDVTFFPAPGQSYTGLTVGPDSHFWFLSGDPSHVIRMATDGTFTEFFVPIENPSLGITVGSDGNLWFGNAVGRIARMTLDGNLTQYRLQFAETPVGGLASGPDGNVWFTEGDYIGKVVLSTVGFYTVTPCRVVDTRAPTGPLGGPALAAGATRAFNISASCGLPVRGTVAAAVNLTVTNASGPGYLQLYPAGTNRPPTSAINFRNGIVRNNNAIVSLDVDGKFVVFCEMPGGGTADLIVDVTGHFQ
jgi:streptogramin lyase